MRLPYASGGPFFSVLPEKKGGRKGALGYVWCVLHLNSREVQCFHLAFHSIVTLRASYYAPPDTGVSGLQLVAFERLPSIESAAEILMDVAFLRANGFPYEGKLSAARLTDEVDGVA